METVFTSRFYLYLAFFLFLSLQTNDVKAQHCTGCLSSTQQAPDPSFINSCDSTLEWFTDLDVCDSTQSPSEGFVYLTDQTEDIYPAVNYQDMTYGGESLLLAGKIFSNDNPVLVWGLDSVYAETDEKLCIGAEFIALSQSFDESYQVIVRVLNLNDSILSSDTFTVQALLGSHPLSSVWQASSNDYVQMHFYILTSINEDAWFAMDNVSIRQIADDNPTPLYLSSIVLDAAQDEFDINIAGTLNYASIKIISEPDGLLYQGTDSVHSIPAYDYSGYDFIGIHSSGCEVISKYWLSKPDTGAEDYASRVGIGNGSPITHRQPWIREGCGLEYTVQSVSTRTIQLQGMNCTPLANPADPLIVQTIIPDTCIRIEEARIYWYEYSNQSVLATVNAVHPATITITNNTTSAQSTIAGILRGQLINNVIVAGQQFPASIIAWRAIIPAQVLSHGTINYTITGLPRGTSAGDVDGLTMVTLYTDLNGTRRGYFGMNESFMLNNSPNFYNNLMPNVTPLNINNHCQNIDTAEAFMVATNYPVNSPITVANTQVNTPATNCYTLFQSNNIQLPMNSLSNFTFYGRHSGPFAMYWQGSCDACSLQPEFTNNLFAMPNNVLCVGDTLNLISELDTLSLFPNIVNNDLFPNYSWSLGNGPFSPPNSNTNFIPSVNLGHNGFAIISVTLNNPTAVPPIALCNAIFDTVDITVNPLPTVNLSIRFDTICPGGPDTLIISLTGSAPWDVTVNGQVYNTSNSPLLIPVNPTTTTTYTITHVSDVNCSDSLNISGVIHISPAPNAWLGNSSFICIGDTAQIDVYFSGLGPWDFTWSDGLTTFSNTGITSNPYFLGVSPSSTQWFYLTQVTDQCTTQNILDSIIVTVHASPGGTLSASSDTICPGKNVDLVFTFTGTGPWDIVWSDGITNFQVTGITSSPYLINVVPPQSPATYYWLSVTGPGCTIILSDSVTIYFHTPPVVDLGPNLFFCTGGQSADTVTIGLSSPPTGSFGYLWDTGHTTPTINVATQTPNCYSLFVLDSVTGCHSTDTVCIDIVDPPSVKVNYSFNCNTNCYNFTASLGSHSTGPLYYQWVITYPNNPLPLPLSVAHYTSSLIDTVTWCPDSLYRMYYLTLTVTDSFGCTTIFTDSILHTNVSALSSLDAYICPVPNSVYIGAPEYSFLQGYIFSWTGPGSWNSNDPNPEVFDTDAGVYSVIIMSNDSSCVFYDTLQVHACCIEYDASMPPPTDTFQIISDGTIINNSTVASSLVWIFGKVTITGIVNWQNKTIIMAPYAQIDIPDSHFYCPWQPCGSDYNRLTIDSTHIMAASCDTMWNGIHIYGDSTYFDSIAGGLYIINNSLVEHATSAIHSIEGGPYAVQNSTLNENFMHISIGTFKQYLPSHTWAAHMTMLDGANLSCTNRLKFPYTSQRTRYGIYIRNLPGGNTRAVSIPIGGIFSRHIPYLGQRNHFDNMDIGIYSEYTQLSVKECDFNRIVCNSGFSNSCPIQTFALIPPTAIISNLSDSTYIGFNTMDRCDRGIHSRETDKLIVEQNKLTNVTSDGVFVELTQGIGPINIHDNYIHKGRNGISVQFNSNTQISILRDTVENAVRGIVSRFNNGSSLDISDNNVFTYYTQPTLMSPKYTGIMVSENQSMVSAEIMNNRIRVNFRRILIDGNPSGTRIRFNKVNMYSGFTNSPSGITGLEGHGISVSNNFITTFPAIRISKDTIFGPVINTNNNFLNTQNNIRGVFIRNGFANQVYCNVIDSVRDNFQANNVNRVLLRRNLFGRGRTAVFLDQGGIIGDQGSISLSYAWDNEFACPYLVSTFRAENWSLGSASQIVTKNASPFTPCTPVTTSHPINSVALQVGHIPGATSGDITALLGGDFCSNVNLRVSSEEEEETLEDVISKEFLWKIVSGDSLNYDSVGSAVAWNARFQAYITLHQSDSLRQDSLLQAFYDDADSASYGYIRRSWTSMALGDPEDAEYWLSLVPDSDDIAYAYARVYMSILALQNGTDWSDLDREDTDLIAEMAASCPEDMGMVVQLSRGVLAQYSDIDYIADCEYPLETFDPGPEFEPDTVASGWLHAYPNPADEYVNIVHSWEDEGEMKIIIINNQGSIVFDQRFDEFSNEMQVDVSEWQQGAYYIILLKDDGYMDSRILIVYHP